MTWFSMKAKMWKTLNDQKENLNKPQLEFYNEIFLDPITNTYVDLHL